MRGARACAPRARAHASRRIYDATKGALSRDGLTLKIAAATIAATIGSSLANPADLVKGAPRRLRSGAD